MGSSAIDRFSHDSNVTCSLLQLLNVKRIHVLSRSTKTGILRKCFTVLSTGWLWWLHSLVGLILIFNTSPFPVDKPNSHLSKQNRAGSGMTRLIVNTTHVCEHPIHPVYDSSATCNEYQLIDEQSLDRIDCYAREHKYWDQVIAIKSASYGNHDQGCAPVDIYKWVKKL